MIEFLLVGTDGCAKDQLILKRFLTHAHPSRSEGWASGGPPIRRARLSNATAAERFELAAHPSNKGHLHTEGRRQKPRPQAAPA